MKKRRVCFIITSFIHYSRNLLVLEVLRKRTDVDLHVIIGGTALLSKYSSKFGHVKELLVKAGFKRIHEVYFHLEGDIPTTKAKTAGLGVIEFANIFNEIRPDLVMIRGDRFEMLSAATAASFMNIMVAHIEGGDATGSIDESVRHAITKMSHVHFPTNEVSRRRLIRMGEDPKTVFNFGSPDIEMVRNFFGKKTSTVDVGRTGSGARIDVNQDFLMVLYHPVWNEAFYPGVTAKNTRNLLAVIHELNIPTMWFWPNFDVGAEEVASEIRRFNDVTDNHNIRFMRYLPPHEFLAVLSKTKCLIGNSSSGIKESSYIGTPVVNIGLRQHGRTRAKNVIDTPHTPKGVKKAIKKQLQHGPYKKDGMYSKPGTSKNIAKITATYPFYIQKLFVDSK